MKNAQILVVEDDPSIRNLMRMMLEIRGYEVITAGDGEEGLQLWREKGIGMIFMDVRMPVMGGCEAAQKIREEERRIGRTPASIVALTAAHNQEEQDFCTACGMDTILAKPVKMKDLFSTIHRFYGPARH